MKVERRASVGGVRGCRTLICFECFSCGISGGSFVGGSMCDFVVWDFDLFGCFF